MFITIYAKFADAKNAEQAMGALLDHGASKESITAFFPEGYQKEDVKEVHAEVNHGITTTTGEDAAVGAAKGAGIGLGIGALAAVASLFIPGFGLVTGGGALATAATAMFGTAVGGAVAGGVGGFLEDQGVDKVVAVDAERALKNGQALVIVGAPSGKLTELDITEILNKYGAERFGRDERAMDGTPIASVGARVV